MGVLSWLKGAANRSAKNNKRSAKQQNKPKKKKEHAQPKRQAPAKKEQPRHTSSRPAQTSHSTSSQNKGGAYKPKAYSANKTSTFQPRTFKPSASTTQSRYAQFKASNVAPKAFKATATPQKGKEEKKPTPVRGAITKATVSPTPRNGSRFDLPKDYDYKKDLKQAAKKGLNTTTLGTQQKKETITLKSKSQQKKEYTQQKKDYYKSKNWKSTKADIKTYNDQRWRKALSDQGLNRVEIDEWMNSEEGKKHRRQTYMEIKTATKKNINKGIAKDIKDTSSLETVNALKKGDFNKMVTAQAMGKKQGNKYLKSVGGDKLLETIGSKNAASAYKGKFITGALQGSGPADVIHSSVGKYNKAAKEANRQTTESGAYMAGYVGGQMAGFGLSKTNAIGKGLTQTLFKSTAKNTGRQIARNATMAAAAETPMNMLDAVKMATDEKGKINKKALAGYMALNTGLSGGMTAGTEGIAAAFTKKNANKLVSLQAKASTGRLTKEEGQELKDLYAKLDKTRKDVAASGAVIADDAYTAGKQMAADARIARGKAKGEQRLAAAQAENTAKQNAKVEKAVEQSIGTMQAAKTEKYNNSLSSYLKRLEESRNDRGLMRGNEEAIENSASGGIVKEAPDSTKLPKGVKADKSTAKSARIVARDELGAAYSKTPAKYSKAEAKEIDDAVDRISNMLAHGNEADARAEARQIARKYGNVDKQFEEPNLQAAEQKKVYADARHTIHGISFRMPEGSGKTIDKWLEDLGTSKSELGQKVKIRKGTGTSRTYSIDEVWGELCKDYPDLFSREVTNPNDRFAAVIDVALKKADDIPDSQLVDILPADIEKMYDDLADKVFAQAEANVKGMKGDIPGRAASADFEAAKPKSEVESPKPKQGKKFYHAGDLGKSEWHHMQAGSSRGTGAYGTGTYFTGDKEILRKEGYGKRPQHEIDIEPSDYNLYRPADKDQGIRVHDTLRTINRNSNDLDELVRKIDTTDEDIAAAREFVDTVEGYSPENLKALNDAAERVLSKSEINEIKAAAKEEAEAASKVSEGEAIEAAEIAGRQFQRDMEDYGLDVSKEELDNFKASYKESIQKANTKTEDEHFFDELYDSLTRELDDNIGFGKTGVLDKIESAKSIIPTLAEDLGKSEADVRNAIETASEKIKGYKGGKEDSASTIVMKELGFEGVDVTGIKGLDNTEYGSVIYDLKPNRQTMKNPAAPYREDAENLMQKAKNQRENERVGAYVEKLKSGETEPPAAKPEEPPAEPKPGDVKDDLKPLDNMSEADLDKVIYGRPKHLEAAIEKYGEDAPRVKQIREYIEEAKKKKEEITKAKNEAIQEKPGYAAFTEDELAPDDPAWSIKARDDSAPTEPVKGSAIKKADKGGNAIMPKSTKFAALRRLLESSLVGFEDVAKQAKNNKMLGQINNVQHWRNKMASWIEGERSGMDRKISGDGLNTIFEKQGLFGKKNIAKRNDFVNYLTYKHAIDRLDYDKPVHMDADGGSMYSVDDYEQMMREIEDRYRGPDDKPGEVPKALAEFESDMRGYFDDLLQMRVDSGLISKDFAETLKDKYPHYIPTLREGDEWMENGIEGGSKQAFGVDNQIKTATGGSSEILDLYQSAAQVTRDVIRDAEQNELLRQYAETLGINTKKVKNDDLLELPSFAASVTNQNGSYRVSFFQDGEMVTMPVDKQIAKGLREVNGQDYQRLLKLAGKLSGVMRLFKAPITDYNLIFGVRNGARDIQQAAVNSKSLKHFSANVPVAQASILRKLAPGGKMDPWMRSYEANGGMYSSFFQQDKKLLEPGAKKGLAKGVDATAGRGLRAIEAANSAIEATPRLAEYIGTIKKDVDAQLRKEGSSLKQFKENLKNELYGAGKELTEDQEERFADEYAKRILEMASTETIETAARNAADITLNFSRNGVIGKALNAGFVPYFNPSIQGLSKTVRMFTENKAEGMKSLMNFGMKLGVLTIAPSAINEITNSDNRDFQNLATREKDANFFIPIGDGKFIKIPKPRENSVLAEPVVYGLRYLLEKASIGEITPPVRIPTNLNLSGDITKDGAIMEGEYSQWKDLGQLFLSARENIGPVDPFKDNLVSPIIRLAQNKTWYGGSIESVGEVIGKKEGELKNSDIYDDTTSATALWIANQKIGGRKVSDIAHMSPKKIDDFMDSYFGIVYDLTISQTSDKAKAERTLQNNPVASQFIKDSVFSNKNGTELWAEFDKANAPKTLGGKIKQKAKDQILGHSALNINEKSQEAKDWLNQKGYDDMTYSTALSTIRGDDSLTKAQKANISRTWKKAQNDLRRDLVYGSKEVSYEKDPIKIISKSVGVDKAMKDYTYTYVDPETGEKKNQHLDAWNAYKKLPEYKKDSKKGGEKFVDFYAKMRWTNGRIGESKSYPSWMTASVLAATEKGNNDDLAKAYIRPNGYDESGKMTDKADPEYQAKIIQRGKNYRDAGFSQSYFRKAQKTLFQSSRKLGYEYKNKMNPWDEAMSLANDKAKYKDGAYYSADTSGKVSRRMNYARGLNTKGYSTKEIYDFAKEYDLKLPNTSGLSKSDRGKAWAAFDAKVEAAVKDKYGDKPLEDQALVYHVITDDSYHKPFGDVGDYSLDGDTGITELDARENNGWGRRGRRRRRGGWGHGGGGGGGGGAAFNPEVNKAGGAAKQTITKAKVTSPFTSNTSKKSNLDDAYRKRAKKLREAQKKTYKS